MSTCPVCDKPTVAAFKPFCCARCREVDLNRWFTGAYTVPAVELDDVDEESLEKAASLIPQDPEEYRLFEKIQTGACHAQRLWL